jgi:SPP1 family predicted phage head-tail adaptor
VVGVSQRSLQASRLRFIATVQRPAAGQDSTGQPSLSFSGTDTVRCSIDTMQGSEGPFATGQQSVITHKITVRSGSNIDTSSRLLFKGGRVFEIVSITDPNNLGHYQEILAKEVVL